MEYMTIDDVAKHYKVHRRTVSKWIASGRLPAYHLTSGRNTPLRIKREDLDKVLEPVGVSRE